MTRSGGTTKESSSLDKPHRAGRSVEDMALVNAVNEAANRGDSLPDIFVLLVRETTKLFSGLGAVLCLLSADKTCLEVYHFILLNTMRSQLENKLGIKLLAFKKIALRPESVCQEYLKKQSPRVITDLKEIHTFLSELAQDKLRTGLRSLPAFLKTIGVGSIISVPLVVDGESMGIIDVAGKSDFTNKDLARLEAIARQLTIIISRKRMEEQLLRERDFNANLIESSPAFFVAISPKGETIMMNGLMLRTLGYTKAEVTGKDYLKLFVPESEREAVAGIFNRLRNLDGPITNENHVRAKDGRELSVEWHGQTVKKSDGSLDYYFGVGIDITERKKMQEQLLLSDRLAAIGELVSGVSHELNNPLTGVIGFSELLLEKDIPENIREDVAVIHHEAERAAEVVKSMLTFARKHTPAKQRMNVNSAVARVLSLRAYEHKVNNIRVITRLSHELPDIIADAFQIQQVFLNVIINAEYFMVEAHNGGILMVTTEKTEKSVRISFSDDGPGIAPENLSRIFDPFFTTKEVGVGTGLGLSISHGIIEEHGGLIQARSRLGEGATFVIDLPLSEVDVKHGDEPK